MPHVYVVSKDLKKLWKQKWFILGTLQWSNTGSSFSIGAGKREDWTQYPGFPTDFSTQINTPSGYSVLGINSGQTNILHQWTSWYQEHKRDKELWLANVNQWRPRAFSHYFLRKMLLLLPAAWPAYGSRLQDNLKCWSNRSAHYRKRTRHIKITISTCPSLYSLQCSVESVTSSLMLSYWVCTPGSNWTSCSHSV